MYLQRALKAPEREKRVKIDFLLMITNFVTGKKEGRKKREIEAVMQNVRITTKEDDCETGLWINRKLATQQKNTGI